MSDPTIPPTVNYESAAVVGAATPADRSTAMIAHILGLLGILGTGIWYLVKKGDPSVGPFARDQMKEAFNFHLAVFLIMIAINILSAIVVGVTGSAILAILFGLASLVVYVGVLVLLIMNAIKANKGELARYPIKIPAIK